MNQTLVMGYHARATKENEIMNKMCIYHPAERAALPTCEELVFCCSGSLYCDTT